MIHRIQVVLKLLNDLVTSLPKVVWREAEKDEKIPTQRDFCLWKHTNCGSMTHDKYTRTPFGMHGVL